MRIRRDMIGRGREDKDLIGGKILKRKVKNQRLKGTVKVI
jgi:hypothetical protein